VRYAAINEANGHIALLCEQHLHVYTLNGSLIASARRPTFAPTDYKFGEIVRDKTVFGGGLSFHHKEFAKEGPLLALGLGNNVCLWRLKAGVSGEPPWRLVELKRLHGPEGCGKVSAVRFVEETLYACFAVNPEKPGSKSTFWQWNLPEGGARELSDIGISRCEAGCGRTFGLLERMVSCGGCGGKFCSADAFSIEGFSLKYCASCRVTWLSTWMCSIADQAPEDHLYSPDLGGALYNHHRGRTRDGRQLYKTKDATK